MDASPVPLDPGVTVRPGQVVGLGWFCRKELSPDNRVWFDDDAADEHGLPAIRIDYALSAADEAAIAAAKVEIAEAAQALGRPLGEPFVMPPGSSLHYLGTTRMGTADDGTSVCDPTGRVWGTANLYVGGNNVIPTATACNPTADRRRARRPHRPHPGRRAGRPRRPGGRRMTPRVLIVGSGPTGATYARRLLETRDDVSVLMVEAGPVVSTPPGMNVKNIPDPQEQAAARLASQGRATESGVSGIPGGVVVEGTITARQGTHLIGRAADGSPGMPAAAGATCVGGQGVHWTCATPAPIGPERIAFIDDGGVGPARARTPRRCCTSTGPRSTARRRRRRSWSGSATSSRPTASPSGRCRWPPTRGRTARCGGAAPTSSSGRGCRTTPRFTLRAETLCVRVVREGDRVVGAVLRDQRTGAEEEVRADAVVLAADAIRTPQLLWASGIRPAALGRYLTEHPLLFGVVAVRPDVLPPRERSPVPDRPDPGHRGHPVRRGAAPLLRPDDVQPGLARRRCRRAAGSATTRPATSAWAGGSASGRGRRTG